MSRAGTCYRKGAEFLLRPTLTEAASPGTGPLPSQV